jgi:L-fuconolactonase
MRLDAHQHYWRYSSTEHIWMTDQMSILKRDFLPEDAEPLLKSVGFDGCIAVQARQNLEETRWLLELARKYGFIQAVVGWVDLCSDEVAQQLERFAVDPKLAGVRHVLIDEPYDRYMLRPEFRRGISRLRESKLTYDLLLLPKHLPLAVQLVEEFPDQWFVLDHIGQPPIAEGLFSPWREDLLKLAEFPNVYCKLSGLVFKAKWRQWRQDEFRPYLDIVFEAFGVDRVMIGSNWPVCTLSADFEDAMRIVTDYAAQFSLKEQAGILGGNCARFYGLRPEGDRSTAEPQS